VNALPAGWRVLRLGDLAETALGKMLDAARPKGILRVPYLRNVNVQWGRIDTADVREIALNADERDRFRLKTGDLLVCEGGEIGRAAIWRGRTEYMAYQKALHRVQSRGDLDLTYLRYLLEYYADTGELRSRATGSTILHLPQQKLRELPVPLPPIAEQHRIVEALESNLSRLAAANVTLGGVLRKLDALLLAGISKVLFSSARWPSKRLADVLETSIGGVWGSEPGVESVDVRVIRVTELSKGGSIVPYSAASRSISDSQLTTRTLRIDDLLLEKSGGGPTQAVGRVGLIEILESLSVCSNFMQLMRPNPSIVSARFLFWYLHGFYLRGGTKPMQKATTNIRNLKASEYVDQSIPIPSLQEQQALVSTLDRLCLESERLRDQVREMLKRQHNLRRALLAAAFNGRLIGSAPSADLPQELVDV